jgi:Uma2 family endonuclease
MSLPRQSEPDLYEQLRHLPENLVGEIIGGQLITQPRPAGPHVLASSSLGADLHGAYQRGRGGPGGWWIIDEPELHCIRDTLVLVPDIAGWRRERLPRVPQDQRFEVVPDWVCEVLSPSTAKADRVTKMPIYAEYGVAHVWLLDPLARTLEAFALNNGRCWTVIGLFKDQDEVSVAPFTEIKLPLADLWVEDEP